MNPHYMSHLEHPKNTDIIIKHQLEVKLWLIKLDFFQG